MTETKKDDIFKDLSEKGKEILSKHLDGRIYKESKIYEWINLILNDSENYFKNKYPLYNIFVYCAIFSNNTSFYSNYTSICVSSSESATISIFKSDQLYSCLYFFYFKNFNSDPCLSLEPKILFSGNKLLCDIFDERKYNEKTSNYCKRLNDEHITNILNIDRSRRYFFLTLAFKKPLIEFSYNYRYIYPHSLKEIIQTFFTSDTEILHFIFMFSNVNN